MKSSIKSAWIAVPVWGRILLACFVFYFIAKTQGKH
jgi:hypothetical protein